MKKSYENIKMDGIECNSNCDNDNRNYSKLDFSTITRGLNHIQYALYSTPSGSHSILVYSDIRILQATYPNYIKS